jgi:hypothetical protein
MTTLKRALAMTAILGLCPPAATSAPQAGPQMTITPSGGYYSSGPQGGPFNPGVQTFTMKNTGAVAINYTVSADQPWVTVFLTSGTMNPGETWGNPVFIATSANSLAPGTHSATITFTNTTNGSGDTTRTVTLIVGSTGDTISPTVTITNPAPPTATSATASVTISGTASDDTGVTSMYWVNMLTNESGTMAGAANWTFSVGLVNGDNLIYVLGWDGSGNQGTASITIHYGPLTGPLMAVSPATGFTSAGPAGGPFSPPQQVYTVSNTGTTSMNFTATGTQPWLNVFNGSGTLAAGGTANVILSFTAAADSLAAGTYTDTVTFANSTNGMGNSTRSVSLVVGSASDTTPPTITIVNPAPPTATALLSPITISGTASDNVGVAAISWQNAEALQSGSVAGGTSWSVTVPLVAGTNTITVTARDAGGNSASASIVVTLGSAPAPAPTGSSGGKSHHCMGAVAADARAPFWTLLLATLLLGASFRRQSS